MELESWLDSFVVDSKVYDRICWIEPANEMWREVLKLLKDGAFKKPDPKVITQKFKTYPNPKTRTGLEATEMGKTERLGKIIANNDKKNNLSSFIQDNIMPLLMLIFYRGIMTKSKAFHKAKREAKPDDPAIVLTYFDGRTQQFEVMNESKYLSGDDSMDMTEVETVYAN